MTLNKLRMLHKKHLGRMYGNIKLYANEPDNGRASALSYLIKADEEYLHLVNEWIEEKKRKEQNK